MKPQHLILILTLTVSCTETENQPASAGNTDSLLFKEFLELIPDTSLPMEIYCGFQCAMDTVDRSRYKRFLPESFSTVVGKVNWKPGKFYCVFYAVIGDIPYPYVYTFDYSGNRIDSVYLHNGYCAGNEHTEMFTYTKIREDMTLFMTDTMHNYWYIEDDADNAPARDSILITNTIRKMDNKGYFHLVSSKDSVVLKSPENKRHL